MDNVLYTTENGYPPEDGLIYRIIKMSIEHEDCIVEVKNIDAEDGFPGSDWKAVENDGTCAEIYSALSLKSRVNIINSP
ncbi:MAG TPA: hypothetical protein VIE65_12410 [Methylobacter sp.]|jgi:hypothetical protein